MKTYKERLEFLNRFKIYLKQNNIKFSERTTIDTVTFIVLETCAQLRFWLSWDKIDLTYKIWREFYFNSFTFEIFEATYEIFLQKILQFVKKSFTNK